MLGVLFGFDAEKSQTLGIMLHAGSFFAIVIFYWKILIGFFKPEQWRLAGMLIVASIPVGTIGAALEFSGLAKELFDNMMMVGFAFLITATLLRLSEKPKLIVSLGDGAGPTPLEKITFRQALAVGFGQMCAIIPGLSRSGTTITVGVLSGINREAAGTFSFLLALPAIAGAVLAHLLKLMMKKPEDSDFTVLQLSVALLISGVVSYWALVLLVRLIKRGKLSVFSWYLYALGAGVILWQLAVLIRRGN